MTDVEAPDEAQEPLQAGDSSEEPPPGGRRAKRPDRSTGEPVRMAYRLLPSTPKGRLVVGAVYAVLMLIALAIVGRGPTSSVSVDGRRITFAQAGEDAALPTARGLGEWTYAGGSWSVDGGAVGQASESGVTFATLTPKAGASVEAEFSTLADGAGVVFRYQDPLNYWGVRAVPSYGGWNIFKVVDGRETVVRVLVGQALDGTRVVVQQSGGRFRVALNGLVRSRIDDAALSKARGVGLMSPPGDDSARIGSITVGTFDGRIAMRSGDDEQQDEIVPSLNPGGT